MESDILTTYMFLLGTADNCRLGEKGEETLGLNVVETRGTWTGLKSIKKTLQLLQSIKVMIHASNTRLQYMLIFIGTFQIAIVQFAY